MNSTNGREHQRQPPACRRCRHFFITHEPDHPYGCRAMGFKSQRLPWLVVREASGMACQMFEERCGR